MSAIIGHSHPEIVEVVSRTVSELVHLHSTILSRPVVELAALLAELSPGKLDRVLLLRPAENRMRRQSAWRSSPAASTRSSRSLAPGTA
jgi:2,2-dialkylglycine decarboxylase (pyruvate)